MKPTIIPLECVKVKDNDDVKEQSEAQCHEHEDHSKIQEPPQPQHQPQPQAQPQAQAQAQAQELQQASSCIICLENRYSLDDIAGRTKTHDSLFPRHISCFRSTQQSDCRCEYYIHSECYRQYKQHLGCKCPLCKKYMEFSNNQTDGVRSNNSNTNAINSTTVVIVSNRDIEEMRECRFATKVCLFRCYMCINGILMFFLIYHLTKNIKTN